MQYQCPKCGSLIEEGTNPCPTCGQVFNWPKKEPEEPVEQQVVQENNEPQIENNDELQVSQEETVDQPDFSSENSIDNTQEQTIPEKKEDNRKRFLIALIASGAFVLLIVLLASLFGNGSSNSSNSNSSYSTTTTTTAQTTKSTIVSYNTWKKVNRVDEFDNYVGTTIIGLFDGSFDNSATSDSDLYVKVYIWDYDVIGFNLYEYGKYEVKNNSSKYGIDFTVKIQDCDGTQYTLEGGICPSAKFVTLVTSYNRTFLNALEKGDVKVYLVNDDYPSSKYYFTVHKHNFDSVFDYNF